MVKIVDSADSDWQSNIVVKQDFFDDFAKYIRYILWISNNFDTQET